MEQPKPSTTGAFIGGLIVGLFVGGLPLMVANILAATLIAGALRITDTRATTAVFLFTLVPVAALGVCSFLYARKKIDFFAGMLVGATAGLLGGTGLCLFMISGLGHMN